MPFSLRTFAAKYIAKPHAAVVGLILLASCGVLISLAHHAQQRHALSDERIFEGTVTKVVSQSQENPNPIQRTATEQILKVQIMVNGRLMDKEASNDFLPVREGDKIYVQGSSVGDPEESWYVLDVRRGRGLMWLTIVFVALVLITSGIKGANSLVGLAFSFAVIFGLLIPAILKGYDPILMGLVSSVLILLVGFYASYGINRKSLAALIGISISLICVALLSVYVVHDLHFSGFSSEDAVYLNSETNNSLNLASILIAGIIIAAIGVLDDVAITQASIVSDLSRDGLSKVALFKRAMSVGQDHISAVVNTLVLAYAGAAMPLLLLLAVNKYPLGFVVNGEVISEEIVRTLISSSGLILAVPLTTLVAVFLCHKES